MSALALPMELPVWLSGRAHVWNARGPGFKAACLARSATVTVAPEMGPPEGSNIKERRKRSLVISVHV